jgi:lipopolysaccharide export system protein LptA
MRLSIQKLRWFLLAGALLLVVVLTAYIGYGRYRAIKTLNNILARSGATIKHDTTGFTYSQSVQGKTVFTLHAKRATQLGDGKWTLHDADMTLYGRVPNRPDHIYGNEVQYDENDGVARAIGEVHMDLQAPEALAGHSDDSARPAPLAANGDDEHIIHIKTSSLVYLRKLGVAATDQQVELHYGGMQCTAQGAEFNTEQNILRLLADVKMDGVTHDKPLHVTALHADIDRNANHATLARPIITSQGRTGKADSGIVDFESDGSIHRVQGFGNVVLSEATRQITAARLDAKLNDDMQLQAAHLVGGVGLVDVDPLRPMQGAASQVDATFDSKGEPTSMTASGGAHFAMVDRRANPRGLARSLQGNTLVATFTPAAHTKGEKAKTQLSSMHAIGSARAASESVVAVPRTPSAGATLKAAEKPAGTKNTQVAGDDLRITFHSSATGKAQPQRLVGAGHTMLQQDAPLAEKETSAGDALDIVFATEPHGADDALTITSAVQTGNVVIHDQAATTAAGQPGAVSNGTAQRAAYDSATDKLKLTGEVHWKNDSGQLIAPTVVVNRQTQDADADGGVQATLFSASGAVSTKGAPPAQAKPGEAPAAVTHILAASAQMHHVTQISEFRGSDAHPAKMWQDASQVEAATLLFDGAKHTFSARPAASGSLIHAVFTGKPSAPKAGAPARAASVLRAASPKMDYNDLRREATFNGGVIFDGTMGEVRGQRAVVFLMPADQKPDQQSAAKAPSAPVLTQQVLTAPPTPFSGSLDRVVVYGDVQLQQPGRKGAGDQLLYTAATGNYVLTGTPARPPVVVDAQQGSITGATLLFSDAGSTIVVAGDPATKTRVRTETEVRP